MDFEAFPKLSRLFRDCTITEKLDGTNAQIAISEDGLTIRAGSRSRWVTPEADNYGFAAWVESNREDLLQLGPGRHFGEWWGQGIQRRYGLEGRRFSLFNVDRWGNDRPACCSVVPVLYRGPFDTCWVNSTLEALDVSGSVAAPGFPSPEGIVVFHHHARTSFKVTLGGDGHKGA